MHFRIRAKALVGVDSMYPRLKPGVTEERMQGYERSVNVFSNPTL